MPTQIIKQHYMALVKLLKVYRTAPLDRNLLKASQHFCKDLYEAAKAHPDLIFAQPHLYKPQLPFVVNLAFNSVLFTCLLSVRNKFDPSVTIQLMCGSLSIYALEQSSIEKHYQTDENNEGSVTKAIGHKNDVFSQLLKKNQQHIWCSSYQLCCKIHLTHYPRHSLTTPTTALAYMANRFALLCTPHQHKHKQPISFALAIKYLSLKCCPRWYDLLIPLLQYPSLFPPGGYIRLRDGSIHIVLSLSIKGLVTKPLPTKPSIGGQLDKSDIQLTPLGLVIKGFPCQPLNSFTRFSQWWSSDLADWLCASGNTQVAAFNSILPMQAAPASLLVIQDQLTQINADITVIVKAIEKEPAYARQLQISASISNRKKKSVQNIQHGLAMLGFERASNILLQHSLLSRLNQQYFPLQQVLLTFSQFFVFIAGKMAAKTKLVSPESASSAAYFVLSRLFTLPTIRTLNDWETSTLPSFKVASLVKVKETESLKNNGFLLANAWQQNKQILEVLQHYDIVMGEQINKRSSRQFCYLLGLSLTLAQEHYFSRKTRCKETSLYFEAGLGELGMNQAQLMDMMTGIMSSENIFCPLG
jgi:HD-like signal output (HDOD) protein